MYSLRPKRFCVKIVLKNGPEIHLYAEKCEKTEIANTWHSVDFNTNR